MLIKQRFSKIICFSENKNEKRKGKWQIKCPLRFASSPGATDRIAE